MHALSIKNLTKTYRNGIRALKGIDLEVESGDFYALLGPNGAGKTTAIGIISSLVSKTAGEVKIFGHSIDDDLEAAKSCIGLVPQELNMNLFDTVLNIVVNQAGYSASNVAWQCNRRRNTFLNCVFGIGVSTLRVICPVA